MKVCITRTVRGRPRLVSPDFFSPNPMTSFPASLSLITSGVKSLSLDTMQNPATPRSCNRSIAVIVSSMSAEFFPVLT